MYKQIARWDAMFSTDWEFFNGSRPSCPAAHVGTRFVRPRSFDVHSQEPRLLGGASSRLRA